MSIPVLDGSPDSVRDGTELDLDDSLREVEGERGDEVFVGRGEVVLDVFAMAMNSSSDNAIGVP
jgi:hypothetical protein